MAAALLRKARSSHQPTRSVLSPHPSSTPSFLPLPAHSRTQIQPHRPQLIWAQSCRLRAFVCDCCLSGVHDSHILQVFSQMSYGSCNHPPLFLIPLSLSPFYCSDWVAGCPNPAGCPGALRLPPPAHPVLSPHNQLASLFFSLKILITVKYITKFIIAIKKFIDI